MSLHWQALEEISLSDGQMFLPGIIIKVYLNNEVEEIRILQESMLRIYLWLSLF